MFYVKKTFEMTLKGIIFGGINVKKQTLTYLTQQYQIFKKSLTIKVAQK